MARVIIVALVLAIVSYIQADRECGYNNPVYTGEIVRGLDAVLGQFPWQISIEYYNTDLNEWRHTCGASLISDEWMVTAAHCTGRGDIQYRIILGQVNRNDAAETQVISLQFTDFIAHENYSNVYSQPNDIAVAHLPEIANLDSPYITPICLPPSTTADYSDNPDCNTSGWGLVNGTDEDVPDHLQYTPTTVLTMAGCRHYLPIASEMHECSQNRELDSGTCYGDSGGPLACPINGRYDLVGATSFGVVAGCVTRSPSYYASVPNYVDWIIEHTGVLPPN